MSESDMTRRCIHVYTGDGKGKTTAALGVALRALGWGLKVYVIQFIKGYPDIGEAKFADYFPERYVLKQFAEDKKRAIGEAETKQRKTEAEAAMRAAEEVVSSGEYDLVILDEINNAVYYGLIDKSRLLRLMQTKPDNVELILTGRSARSEVIEAADYVTEMKLIKHPYERGIQARSGFDY